MVNTWNGNYTPGEGDLYNLVTDLAKGKILNNRIIPVYSKAERDGLSEDAPNQEVPAGTVVSRIDLGGALEIWNGDEWVSTNGGTGRQYLSFTRSAAGAVEPDTWTPITKNWDRLPGSPTGVEAGITWSGGEATVPRSGLWRIWFATAFATSNGTAKGGITARINASGTNNLKKAIPYQAYMTISIDGEWPLDAGTVVFPEVYQSTNAAQGLHNNSEYTRFGLRYIGPK